MYFKVVQWLGSSALTDVAGVRLPTWKLFYLHYRINTSTILETLFLKKSKHTTNSNIPQHKKSNTQTHNCCNFVCIYIKVQLKYVWNGDNVVTAILKFLEGPWGNHSRPNNEHKVFAHDNQGYIMCICVTKFAKFSFTNTSNLT